MQQTGTVTQVLPLESGESKAGKAWSKQTFIIEFMDGSYSKKLAITAMNDKISLIPGIGQEVKVDCNASSREYNGRWYTDISLWKCEVVSGIPAKLEDQPDNDLPF